MDFKFFHINVSLNMRARWPFTHFKVHKHEYSVHVVWGKFSLHLHDTTELVATCAQCGSLSIGEVGAGDEGWTVCKDCQSVEQGYKYVPYYELEAKGLV